MSKTMHELTRKEMKAPDRFQVAVADAASWMGNHQKQLALAAAAAVVLAVVAAGASSVIDSRRSKSGGLLYRAIETASGEISSIPLPNVDRVYKTVEEKERAVIDAASKVREQAGGSRAAVTATLLEADAHLTLGEWDKAIAAYQSYLSKAPKDDSLRFAALDGLARAEEGKGDLDGAAKTYQQASEIAFFKDRATLERARVLSKAGKADEARKALEDLPKESPLRPEAQEQLARLAVKR